MSPWLFLSSSDNRLSKMRLKFDEGDLGIICDFRLCVLLSSLPLLCLFLRIKHESPANIERVM